MNPVLSICDAYRLPLEDYAGKGLRVGIWASSGRGKSFGVGVFCEELLSAGIPVIAIDPEGELFTLREQFRVLVLGGEHGDLPLPAGRAGVRLALTRALDEGLGLVLDLSDRPTNRSQQEAAKPWLEQLWLLMSERRTPAALVVEEVHIFAPQSGASLTADQMQRFAKQGRKRGAILVAASQRTQAVSKEFMSQLNFPAIGGFETERDYEAVKAVVDGHSFDEFRALEAGRFFLTAAGGFYRWRARRTSHGGEAPTWAPADMVEAGPRDATLDALVEQLRTAFADEAAPTPASDPMAESRQRIRDLESDLKKAREDLVSAQDEARRLGIALQVASLVKVVIQHEIIQKTVAAAVPLPPAANGETVAVVSTTAAPAEPSLTRDVRLKPDELLETAEVKSLIRQARGKARRRAPRSTEFMHVVAKALAGGSTASPAEMAARCGYYSQVAINRIGHVMTALVEVGFATSRSGRYCLNEGYLLKMLTRG